MTARLPQPLESLLDPGAYSHPVESVELIETHISWVLLAGKFAYKIKRPVCYPFVDLRSPQRRRRLCEEEVRLNRRFAPELYLGVSEVVSIDGEARMDAKGPTLEHAVRMRRFDRADELDRLLDAWRIEPAELESFGRELAAIHARLAAATEDSPWGRPADIAKLVLRNLEECAQASAVFDRGGEVLAMRPALEGRLASAAHWMTVRRAAGRVRECHGDLHCRNIVRLGSRLVAFDCLEFDPALRWIDVADEVALLSCDLVARNRPLRAHAFRGGYLAQSGDYAACRVLKLYQAHRALVRAKVAALAAAGASDEATLRALREEHLRLIACGKACLDARAQRPALVLMSGVTGCGKTWLARQLAPRLSAVHLRSDVERKRRAGLAPLAASHSGIAAELYSPEVSEAVYEGLAQAAEDVLAGGYAAVVDAAFLLQEQRALFSALARRLDVPLHVVLCQAPDAVLRARIAARRQSALDASEADSAVLDWQLAHRQELVPREGIDAIRVESGDAVALESILARIRGSPEL
jgi:uncharacterized protein